MQRGMGAALVMVVASSTLTAGCSASGSACWTYKPEVSPNEGGASTAQAAIDALAAQGTVEGLPNAGWIATSSGDSYTSAAFTLTVTTVPGHTGFFVTKVSTCGT
jgi:hypothetical protein